MGLIEELRKKFQKENADNLIKINIEINGNAKELLDEIKKIQTAKIGRKRKGAKL
jgi:hypothetical protein